MNGITLIENAENISPIDLRIIVAFIIYKDHYLI